MCQGVYSYVGEGRLGEEVRDGGRKVGVGVGMGVGVGVEDEET